MSDILKFLPAEARRELTLERLELIRQIVSMRDAIRELLQMIAMVPESMLTGLRVDPYGTIGDALEIIGESREPDAWSALFRFAGLGDPGPPPATEEPSDG